MQEISIQTIDNGEIAMSEATAAATNAHTHEISAINGLPKKIKELECTRGSFESSDTGHANYHIWDSTVSTDDKKSGIFVTCNNQGHIKPCTGVSGEDIFGVTVSSAAFIGGQSPANVNDNGEDNSVKRGSDYGLVVTNGFVYVRCAAVDEIEDEVEVGDAVVAGNDGLAIKKTDVQHGNKVVAIKTDEGVRYAQIYLGLSPKQAVDIAGDVKVLQSEMNGEDGVKASIGILTTKVDGLDAKMTSDVNITGGSIGGWDVTENSLEKSFGTETGVQYKVALDSNATGSYVFGVKEMSTSEGTEDVLKFGIKSNGEADIARANISDIQTSNGLIGGWNVTQNGFKIERAQKDICTVSGTWDWNGNIAISLDIEQAINFITDDGGEFVKFKCTVAGENILYCNESSDLLVYNKEWIESGTTVDFGTDAQYTSKEFYDFLIANATPRSDAVFEYQEDAVYTVVLNSNTINDDSKILEIKNNDESKFYLKLDGAMHGRMTSGSVGGWEVYENGLRAHICDGVYAAMHSQVSGDDLNEETVFLIEQDENPVFYVRPSGATRTGHLDASSINITGDMTIGDQLNTNWLHVYNQITADGRIFSSGTIATNGQLKAEDANGNVTRIYGNCIETGGYLKSSSNGNTTTISSSSVVTPYVETVRARVAGQMNVDEVYISTNQGLKFWCSGNDTAERALFLDGNDNLALSWHGITITSEEDHDGTSMPGQLVGTWKLNGASISTTSDANKKHSIENIDERYSVFFDNLVSRRFKYNSGTSDRYHNGYIAQEVEEALQSANIEESEFAGIVTFYKGTEKEERGLRYEEFISLNTWQIQKLKSRIKELEDKVAALSNN